MYKRLKNLLSPLFIFCLVLLILNDFILKAAFHNTLTGKLSDFCGLFIFPIFWSAVFPKHKLSVFILTGVLFSYWKSEYASGLIEMVNTIFSIQRTVDPTDLLALPVLFLGWLHIKGGLNLPWNNSLVSRLTGLFVGTVAVFSFCATTQQRYVQGFDQPQYVLLHCSGTLDTNSYYDYHLYKKDSLLVVGVNQLFISKPVRDDDFNKNRSIKDLDKQVRGKFADSARLIPSGKITVLSIHTAEGKDSLRFNGSRLDGKFIRTKNGRPIIEGFYTMGLEDSIWTFKDTTSTHTMIQTFVNGERTEIKQYDQGKLLSKSRINTREDTIRNKYVQIGILVLLALGVIALLIRNYRSKLTDQLKLKRIWKWLLCFVLPFFVWLLHLGMRILLMDSNQDIFGILAAIFFIFITTCPLMFVVIFGIKLRKEIDILLYSLLFASVCSIWTTYGTLIALSN